MPSDIRFHTEDLSYTLRDKQKIRAWLDDCARSKNRTIGALNYIFCSDAYLLEMNQQYLDHDTFTDIITFDYSEEQEISGDIFISIERTRENALKFKSGRTNELHRVMAHGLLHLCGLKDKTDAEAAEMRKNEENCLSLRTFLRP